MLSCSNSAIVNSVSQRDFVSWVSDWELKLSGPVCNAVETVSVVQDFKVISEHKEALWEEANDSRELL